MLSLEMSFQSNLPQDFVQWIRFSTAIFGLTGFGLLVYRLVGRGPNMSWLSFTVTLLLAISVLGFGGAAARAQSLHAPFNEFALLGLVVNVGSTITGLFWHRWLDKTGLRH